MITINLLIGVGSRLLSVVWAFVGVVSVGINESVVAQVTPDDTLGAESSVVTPDVMIPGI
jgi:hypothetical protein